jgi:hypothetical protein
MAIKQKSKEQRVKSKVRMGFIRKFVLLCSLLIANCSFELYAQTEQRFVQRLAWMGDEYVLRYEVVIEREVDGGYREFAREFTNMSFIDVPLLLGKYRFRVIPYDFLNRAAQDSGWVGFELRLALMPELNDALPVYFYLGENAVHTLNISGRNLDPAAEIELRGPGGISIVPYSKNINPDGSGARLSFNNNQLVPGTYVVNVRNPGGLETRRGTIIVAERPELPAPIATPAPVAPIAESELPVPVFEDTRPAVPPIAEARPPVPVLIEDTRPAVPPIEDSSPAVPPAETEPVVPIADSEPTVPIADARPAVQFAALNLTGNLFFGVAWMPLFPVYGDELSSGQSISLSNLTFRMGISFKQMNFVNLGTEVAVSWPALRSVFNEQALHFLAAEFNLMAQKWFLNERIAFTLRAGIGYTTLLDGSDSDDSLADTGSTHTNIGVSLLLSLYKSLYIEASVDYVHLFTNSSGFFRPWIGFGLRF